VPEHRASQIPPQAPGPIPTQRKRNQTTVAIGLLIAAVACFAVLDTTTKHVTSEVPIVMALWARYFFQALATSAVVLPQRGWSILNTPYPQLQVLRGVLLVFVTLLAFASLQFLPVGEFTAIVMTVPLLVTLLSARLLGERVSVIRGVLVAGGFLGTLIIVRPGSAHFGWSMLIPLGLVVANTAFQLLTSRLSRTEDAHTTQFVTSWIGTLVATIPLIWYWAPVTDNSLWIGLVMMGLLGAAGHFLLLLAFDRAPAATLMPYMYAQIGFGMVSGWLVFGHLPDGWSLLGIGLIAACGTASALLTVRESRALALL
jgi:drug/metabolite transporter (DMT)-like permease